MLLDRESASRPEPPRTDVRPDRDDVGWRVSAEDALDCARLRRAFRHYLEALGHPGSDFDAAETAYGELIANCVRHAPGPLTVEFRWSDATLTVTDRCERLWHWPFSADDVRAEQTHHSFAILRALCGRLHLRRIPEGGTRACVVLPVLRASAA